MLAPLDIILHIDEPFAQNVDPGLIEKALQSTLSAIGATPPASERSASHLKPAYPELTPGNTVTVVVTDSETIQELNQQYRGINAPTDVLSFENIPDLGFPEVDQAASDYLGDIIIAYPVAEAQALAAGHTPQEEITLLAVHGLLHLLGFDHDTLENKQQMWDIQQRIMTGLELAHVQPTES